MKHQSVLDAPEDLKIDGWAGAFAVLAPAGRQYRRRNAGEPRSIGEIIPGVLADIARARAERQGRDE